MYELFTNMFMYIYIFGPVTGSLPAPQWAGTGLESARCWERRTGSCLALALCDMSSVYYHLLWPIQFMSLLWIIIVKSELRMTDICMKYLKICLYFCILGPVNGGLPAVPAWAGTGLESVWCWERRTGSCPVLALCGISAVYYHVLRPIPFMSFPYITHSEIWV